MNIAEMIAETEARIATVDAQSLELYARVKDAEEAMEPLKKEWMAAFHERDELRHRLEILKKIDQQ